MSLDQQNAINAMPMKRVKQTVRLSEFEALMVGAIGGTVETTIQMPLITWKICVQEGRAYPSALREWYRGVFINAGSLSPITAVQCFANSLLQGVILFGANRPLTDIEQLGCSAGAGAISALIYGPVDLMVIQQQKKVASISTTFQEIKKEFGPLHVYRGLSSTMVREAIYTCGYLGVAPVIQGRLKKSSSDWFKEHPTGTAVVAAMIGGSFASVLTHPVDTAKTCVQSDLNGTKFKNARSTMVMLYKEKGIRVLFKGVFPRTLRLCGACFVISQVREGMIALKKRRLGYDEDF